MKCPVCSNVDLLLSQRQGVEIDYCPNCRGVWLDRGELDKIIEREQGGSMRYQSEPPHTAPQPQYAERDAQRYSPDHHGSYEEHRDRHGKHDEHHADYGHHEERRHEQGYEQSHGKHKKRSFLGELFDFD
jgi:uncharacterized protein